MRSEVELRSPSDHPKDAEGAGELGVNSRIDAVTDMRELDGTCFAGQLSPMPYSSGGVSPDVAELQARRYRSMNAAEKLSCADALWELAWDATKAGVRMRRPDDDEAAVARAAHLIFDHAAD